MSGVNNYWCWIIIFSVYSNNFVWNSSLNNTRNIGERILKNQSGNVSRSSNSRLIRNFQSKRQSDFQLLIKQFVTVSTLCVKWICRRSFLTLEYRVTILAVNNRMRNNIANGEYGEINFVGQPLANMHKLYWHRNLEINSQLIANECHEEEFIKESVVKIYNNETLLCTMVASIVEHTTDAQNEFFDSLHYLLAQDNLMKDFYNDKEFARGLAMYVGCGYLAKEQDGKIFSHFVCEYCSKESQMDTFIGKPRSACPAYSKYLDKRYSSLCVVKSVKNDIRWISMKKLFPCKKKPGESKEDITYDIMDVSIFGIEDESAARNKSSPPRLGQYEIDEDEKNFEKFLNFNRISFSKLHIILFLLVTITMFLSKMIHHGRDEGILAALNVDHN